MNFNEPNIFLNLFWLLPIIWVALYYGSAVRSKKLSRFVKSEELKNQLTINVSKFRRQVREVFFLLGILFLITAVAGPHWGTKLIKRPGQSRDLLVVLDTSRSMLANDISPSRLKHAKWFIRNLLDQTPGDRYGLIAFAGTAFLECPLTQDRNGFMLFLNDINTDTIPVGGTNIEKALETALEAFKAAEGSNRAVIFITDGDELQGDSSNIIEDFKERNIPIFVVGIGDPNLGSFIQVEGNKFVLDKNGDRVKSKLNESSLQHIAAKAGGTYVHSTVVHDGLDHIVDRVRNLVPEQHEDNTVSRPVERYQIPLFISFICFSIRLLTGERKQIMKPLSSTANQLTSNNISNVAVLLILGVNIYLSALFVNAQKDDDVADSPLLDSPVLFPSYPNNVSPNPPGNPPQMMRVNSEKDKMIYESIDSLLSQLENAAEPLEQAYLHYNLGVNYQLLGRETQAETEYNYALDSGIDSDELKGVVYQNLGVLKHRESRENIAADSDAAMESLSQAQAYYREAMRYNPRLKDIAVNQELVLKDRKLIEELKNLQQQISDMQKDAQERTQEALDAQQDANQETDSAAQDQKQAEAKSKTEQAKKSTEELEEAVRQMGQENAADYFKQAKEKLDQAEAEQTKAMQKAGQDGEEKESSEKAEDLISQALNQLGIKQEKNDEDSDSEETQAGQKGDESEEENENDDQKDALSEESKGAQTSGEQSDSDNESENDLRNLDQIQALSILNSMQEQERDLKKDLKEAEKQKMGVKDVTENW